MGGCGLCWLGGETEEEGEGGGAVRVRGQGIGQRAIKDKEAIGEDTGLWLQQGEGSERVAVKGEDVGGKGKGRGRGRCQLRWVVGGVGAAKGERDIEEDAIIYLC